MKQVGCTTVMSSSWRHIWASTQLDLDIGTDLTPTPVVHSVSQGIASHQGPFGYIHLTSKAMRTHRYKLREWFQVFASKGVQDLVYVNHWSTVFIRLPDEIVQCTSLTLL